MIKEDLLTHEQEQTYDVTSFEAEPAVVQEIELGQHTLFIYDDNSIDVIDLEVSGPYLAENAVSLDPDETYKLMISLTEHFKQVAQ